LSSEVFNEASKLLEFTNLLAKAKSDAAKRLAEQQLNDYIRDIKTISTKKLNDRFLEKQLEIINLELLEFSDLIWQRANIEEKLNTKRAQMYDTFAEIFERKSLAQSNNQQAQINTRWLTELPSLMITAEKAVNAQKMQNVRGLFASVKRQIAQIQNTSKTAKQHDAIVRIKQLVFAKDGLEYLVISYLKLNGRVIGRESFMRHLIEDFSRLLEMTSNETKANIFSQVEQAVTQSKQRTNTIGLVIIVAILMIFAILFFIQQRILKRLQLFNLMVQNKTRGNAYQGSIKGNDEITDLAEAFNEFAETIEIQKTKLQTMSMTDDLTGIANRRALDIRLQHDIELSVRQKSSVSILLMDIDFFKPYNDNYGHAAGDECLKAVAAALASALQRESDFVARYGGEEFVGILPNTDLDGAKEIAKHIFNTLHELNLPHAHSKISDRITLSMGISISSPQQIFMPDTLMQRADKALYQAKSSGKNTYKVFSEESN
jgi:diguanylate cyclase (GGDEF)-like protein